MPLRSSPGPAPARSAGRGVRSGTVSAASGLGSWPGTDVRTPFRLVRDILTRTPSGGQPGIPYLPELPDRGPGAELVGRTAGLLVELPVDLQPSGWRLVDRPGRDAERTAAYLRTDLDELAEVYDGYDGLLKVQVAGPWTLTAGLRLARGERVVADVGARRDLIASLAEGIRGHLGAVSRLVPGAELVLQLDEPGLPSVLTGELPTSSGFGRLPAVDPQEAREGLAAVLAAAEGRATVVHCCAPLAPLPLLRAAGAGAISLDVATLGDSAWESVAATVEAGVGFWAGVVRTDPAAGASSAPVGHHEVIAPLIGRWRDLGLTAAGLAEVVLTPACGLAGQSPARARATQELVADAAGALSEAATR